MARAYLIRREIGRNRCFERERLFRDMFNPLELLNEKQLYERYRFDRESIYTLTSLLAEDLNCCRRNCALLPVHQVLIALRYYATGTFQIVCGDIVGVSKTTAHVAIWKVTHALLHKVHNFIKFPTSNEQINATNSGFYAIAHFPGIIGAVDGCHIRIQRPHENENDYINRKFFPSINVQAICDDHCRFTNVVAKWPGSSHDAFVWSHSIIGEEFEGGQRRGIFLGDSGYPCKPWLLTPYRDPKTLTEVAYNNAHSRTRVMIECAFGRWKRRFHSMHGEVRLQPDKACKLIVVTAALHNWAIDRRLPDFEGKYDDMSHDVSEAAGYSVVDENGRGMRDHIAQTFFSK